MLPYSAPQCEAEVYEVDSVLAPPWLPPPYWFDGTLPDGPWPFDACEAPVPTTEPVDVTFTVVALMCTSPITVTAAPM